MDAVFGYMMNNDVEGLRRYVDSIVETKKDDDHSSQQLKCEEICEHLKSMSDNKHQYMKDVFDLIPMLMEISYYDIAVIKKLKCVVCGNITLKEFCDNMSNKDLVSSLVMVHHGHELFIKG